MNIGTRQG